ncbi:hypothetical protein TVAG_049840 [Trichomonas vaginalis G3]|uniref:Uncharacterized protein n=1 Tax=Trichomonas vaginalis (strain ATCC PRA-98 / G3) TaxID=412133 RepID=A2EVX9_TRIV3|nr:armadillo (ARM) repeat-containing protein family [Trichomonas vaginalis G3]EAY03200.1 hypothetical protein TVAG_049840 [Trichomonas vaginalis G3]KAI5520351.1 armadillo (ARM) repeat-containing protein family [Trichomonas vaginalis G3]|eukprot:XP_001315423.1 hypothetical protein [Trichomonas vaginalis G3]
MEEFIERLKSIYEENIADQYELAAEFLPHYETLEKLLIIIQKQSEYDQKLITYAISNIARICKKGYFDKSGQYPLLFNPILEIYYSTPDIYEELLQLYFKISQKYEFTSVAILQYFIEKSKDPDTVERAFHSFSIISRILRDDKIAFCDGNKEEAVEVFFQTTAEYLQQEQLSCTILCTIYNEIHGFFQSPQFHEFNLGENPVFIYSLHILYEKELTTDTCDVFLSILNFYYEIYLFGVQNQVAIKNIIEFIHENLEVLVEKFKEVPELLFQILKIINKNFSALQKIWLEKLNSILLILIHCANISEYENDFVNNPAVFYGNTYEAPDDNKILTVRCYVYLFIQKIASPENSEDLFNVLWETINQAENWFEIESLLYLISSLFEKFGNTQFFQEKIPIIFEFYESNKNELLLCSLAHFASKTLEILSLDYVNSVYNQILENNFIDNLIWYLVFSNFIVSIISKTNFEVPLDLIKEIYFHENFANNTISIRLISAIVGNKQYRPYLFELVEDETVPMKNVLEIMIEKDNSKDDDLSDINYHDLLDLIRILVVNFGSNYKSEDCNGETIARAMLNTVCQSIMCMDEAMTVLSSVFLYCEPKTQIFIAIAEKLGDEKVIPDDLQNGNVLTIIYKYYTENNPDELQELINYCNEQRIFDFESNIEYSDGEITITY